MRIRFRFAWTVALAGLSMIAVRSLEARPSSWILIPGDRAGVLRLQSYPTELPLGKADFSDAGMSHYVDMWVSKERDARGLPVNTVVARSVSNGPINGGPGERVECVRVTSPRFRTPDGVGPGSTYATVVRRYPHLSQERGYPTVLSNLRRGIAFEFGSAHPQSADRCVAVSIFAKGAVPSFDAKQVSEMIREWKKAPAQ
jgi:hypothetical protein